MMVEKKECPKCGAEMRKRDSFMPSLSNSRKLIKIGARYVCTKCSYSENIIKPK